MKNETKNNNLDIGVFCPVCKTVNVTREKFVGTSLSYAKLCIGKFAG
jgi:phage FluMu protein Com